MMVSAEQLVAAAALAQYARYVSLAGDGMVLVSFVFVLTLAHYGLTLAWRLAVAAVLMGTVFLQCVAGFLGAMSFITYSDAHNVEPALMDTYRVFFRWGEFSMAGVTIPVYGYCAGILLTALFAWAVGQRIKPRERVNA